MVHVENSSLLAKYAAAARTKNKQEILEDRYDDVLRCFRMSAWDPELSMKMMICGATGSTKTTFTQLIANSLLTNDKRLLLGWVWGTKDILEMYESNGCPFADRVVALPTVPSIEDTPKNMFVVFDEGLLMVSAFGSTKKEMVKMYGWAGVNRHNRNPMAFSCQTPSIARQLRMLVQMRFYKILPDGYLEENPKDKFVQRFAHVFESKDFPIGKTLFRSKYKTSYTEENNCSLWGEGYFDFTWEEIQKAIPWWTRPFSQYFSKITQGSDSHQENALAVKVRKEAAFFVKLYGSQRMQEGDRQAVIHGWYVLHDTDKLAEFRGKGLSDIAAATKTLAEGDRMPLKEDGTAFVLPDVLPDRRDFESFGDFIQLYYPKTEFRQFPRLKEETEFEIVGLIADGMQQRQVASKLRVDYDLVNEVWNFYWGKKRAYNKRAKAPDDLQVWKTYERFCAAQWGGVADGRRGEPDVLLPDGNISFGECKCYYQRDAVLPFYMKRDFGPSIRKAFEHGQGKIRVSIRNVMWNKLEKPDIHFILALNAPDPIRVDNKKGIWVGQNQISLRDWATQVSLPGPLTFF